MLEQDFRSGAGYWIHVCAHRFESAMNAELAGLGITYRQFQVLAWLALEGDSSQVELARLMHVEPPTLVKVLDRMEREQLVARKDCPGDRRKRIITPTKHAVPVWKRIIKCVNRVRGRSIEGLSVKEVSTLRALLKRVHNNLLVDNTQEAAKKKPKSSQGRNLVTAKRTSKKKTTLNP